MLHFLKLRGSVHHLDKDPLVLQRAATDFTKLDETLQEEAESLFQLVDTVLPFAKTKGCQFWAFGRYFRKCAVNFREISANFLRYFLRHFRCSNDRQIRDVCIFVGRRGRR